MIHVVLAVPHEGTTRTELGRFDVLADARALAATLGDGWRDVEVRTYRDASDAEVERATGVPCPAGSWP